MSTTKVEVILSKASDWDEWIMVIQNMTLKDDLFSLINPDTSPEPAALVAPRRPTLESQYPGIPLENLTDKQFKALDHAVKAFDYEDRKYTSQSERLEKVMVHINTHVEREHLLQIQGCKTVWQALVALKQHLAPSDRARRMESIRRYRDAQRAPTSQDHSKWLQEWENAYNDAVRVKLPEAEEDRPIWDLLFAIRGIDAGFAAGREATVAQSLRMGMPMPTTKEMLEDFRNHLRLNAAVAAPSSKGPRGHRGAFGAKLNGEDQSAGANPPSGGTSSGSNGNARGGTTAGSGERKLAPCLCEGDHRYRKCPYLIESARPTNWKADLEVQRSINTKLESNSRLQGFIETLQKQEKEKASKNRKNEDEQKNAPRAPSGGSFCTIAPNASKFTSDLQHPQNNSSPPGSFVVGGPYKLLNCWTLDSGTDVHICNDRRRLKHQKPAKGDAELVAGKTTYKIEAYGSVDITVNSQNGPMTVTLLNVALAPGFLTNLVCLRRFTEKGVHWDTSNNRLIRDGETFCYTQDVDDHWVLEYGDPHQGKIEASGAFAINSRAPKPPVEVTAAKWHDLLGHPGQEALAHLEESVQGATVTGTGPITTKCETCALTKAHELISRRTGQEEPVNKPFERVGWDLIPMSTAYNGDKWVSHFTCFTTTIDVVCTHPRKNDSLFIIQEFVKMAATRHQATVRFLRIDDERTLGKAYSAFAAANGITTERSAPYTPAQNGRTERAGGILTTRARALRIKANMPANLWPEAFITAGYLNNRTPKRSLNWKTPWEALTGAKPTLSHLQPFGCKAYALRHNVPRLDKMDPRALIGYLTGFDSTNIFRIWIPSRGKVIRTRDVIFNSSEYYDPAALDAGHLLTANMETIVQTIQMPEPYKTPLPLVEDDVDDSHLLSDLTAAESNASPDPADGSAPEALEGDDDGVFEMASEIPLLPTPDATPEDTPEPTEAKSTLQEPSQTTPDDSTPREMNKQSEMEYSEHHSGVETPNIVKKPMQKTGTSAKAGDISANFDIANILPTRTRRRHVNAIINKTSLPLSPSSLSSYHSAFAAGLTGIQKRSKLHRNELPTEPQSWRHMIRHQFSTEFKEAANKEIEALEKQKTFEVISKNTETSPIPLIWVFKYKFNSDGYLDKFKARLCVRGDLQSTNQDTYAATLAARTFRALISISAAFNLEMKQYDAVNAFVNSELKEEVYTHCPEGFTKIGHCWRLKKALYGLKEAPLRWYETLSTALEDLDVHSVPGVNCLFANSWLILFFYVDDIVALCKTQDLHKLAVFEQNLTQRFEMKSLGDLNWFLGIRVTRERDQRKVWLTQDSYIDKIAARFALDDLNAKTPLATTPALEASEEAHCPKRMKEFQQKMGSINFAAVITRPDISFAVSTLSRYLQNPSKHHIKAANRVIAYLYATRFLSLEYDGDSSSDVFMCASDAAFADNPDRRSSDGYLFQLFGGPIDWKAAKQRTVTTSSTEAELLSLSRAAKETLWWQRFFTAINFDTGEEMSIYCDNRQTIRLLDKENLQLDTKLRHIDIHRHWLRQEVMERRISVKWVPTAEMPADGLTKALTAQKQARFHQQLNMADLEVTLGHKR
jgi:Reverse transcriptase (RNA-dependent DNA polymerase)